MRTDIFAMIFHKESTHLYLVTHKCSANLVYLCLYNHTVTTTFRYSVCWQGYVVTEQQIKPSHAYTLGNEQVEAIDQVSAPGTREHKSRIQIGGQQPKPTGPEEEVSGECWFPVAVRMSSLL